MNVTQGNMKRKLIDDGYHYSMGFVLCIFVSVIVGAIAALAIVMFYPLVDTPYIGEYYQMLFAPFFEGQLAESVFLFFFNVYLYWFLLLVVLFSITDIFFKELIGYKSGWKYTIVYTVKKCSNYAFKGISISMLFIFSLRVSIPFSEWYLVQMDVEKTGLIQMLFLIFTSIAIYGTSKMLVELIVKKSNKLYTITK